MSASDALLGYRGARGLNFYETDSALRAVVAARPAVERAAMEKRLSAFGALCGGRLGSLIEAAHRPERLPRLARYDASGERVERVEYCLEQKEARRLLAQAMYVQGTLSFFERITLAYLANQNGEGGITCPLAMTEGLIDLLEQRGTSEQRRLYLPVLKNCDPETALPAGQYVTERQGGSNVAANETVARPRPDGSWELTGLKWFCSNPGELWATTAKVEGSGVIGLFLVSRRLPDGSLNRHGLLRLKEIMGTKGKATAEVEYQGARAELIGKASQGMTLLVRGLLGMSRIHVAAGALGYLRRAVLEAELFARERTAYGRRLEEIPYVARCLERLRSEHAAAVAVFYEAVAAIEDGAPAQEALVPLLKVELSRRSSAAVREAQLLIGGHGILEDFTILPRLSADSLINEIWEGTHPILAAHAAKALRKPGVFADLERRFAPRAGKPVWSELAERVERNRSLSEDERSLDDSQLCSAAYAVFISALQARAPIC